MIRLFFVLSMLAPLTVAHAQPAGEPSAGPRRSAQLSLLPVYQQYDDEGRQLSELSVPLALYVPLGRALSVSLRAGQATADADGLESLNGFTDVQVSASYYQAVGSGSVVLALGVNLPSGKQEFTPAEFQIVSLLSQNLYNFRVPSFGRGFGVAPGVTWAQPVSEALVVGVGVSYQLREAFDPLEGLIDPYDPGDELLFTGGFDARLSRTASLATDVTYTLYSPDTQGDVEVFEAGSKTVVSVQLRNRVGFNEAWLFGRYRSRAKNSLAAGGTLVEEEEKTDPDQFELLGQYRHRVHRLLYLSVHGQARLFQETPVVPSATLFGLGGALEVSLSRQARVPVRVTYIGGDVTGFEVGAGLVLSL